MMNNPHKVVYTIGAFNWFGFDWTKSIVKSDLTFMICTWFEALYGK
jgi:hypothetical protein